MSDYDAKADAEIAQWPGVKHSRKIRNGGHMALTLEYGGQSATLFYPATSVHLRGPLNHVRDIRHALAKLGAKRNEAAKSARPRRDTAPPRPVPIYAPLVEPRDPWAELRRLTEKPA